MTTSINPSALYRAALPNGLTVLIYRTTDAPVVAINTYVNAGYFDETDDVVGIAHVLEHMFFKGTERRGVGAIAKETKAVGGYVNAHTIYDHTSYYAVLPTSGFADGLDVQADAYANSVIDAGELAKELEVIIQEAKRKEDNPGAVTTETLYAVLHDRHRIRRWRIGREAPLRALTREELRTFYKNFYTPSNTIVSIAGNVNVDEVMLHVQRLYGSLPDHTPVRTPGPEEPTHTGFRYAELSGDVALTQVELGWRTVPGTHADAPALDMVASVLSAGRASRLYRAVRERKLAGSVSAYNYSPMQVGVFVLNAECEYETAADASRAMWEQLRAVREDGVTADELERCKRLFASRWARRLETSEGIAAYLAEWESIGGWQKGDEYYDAFVRLTPDDVTTVARRYLTPELGAAVVYRPERTAPLAANAEAFVSLLNSSTPAPLEPTPAVALPRDAATSSATFVREVSGVRVYRTDRDIPVLIQTRSGAAITYAGVYASGGAINELPNHAGISALAARTSVKGTATRTAVQIAEASELLGGSISSSVGAELFGWSTSVPRDNIIPALSLLADVVQHATLTDEAIETERTALLADLAQLRDDMYRYPMRLVNTCAYAGHPYGTPSSGTETSVRALKGDDIRDWYRRMLLRAPFVIGVVGDVDADAVAAAIAGEFGELTMSESTEIPAPMWPKDLRESIAHREKAQSALALAFEAPSRHDDRRFAAQVLATIASGLGGRFFDELRDRQSLAYTVHAFASEHRLSGAFVSYIATSPELEDVARTGLLKEFAKLRNEPVTDDELSRAKRYILGMHDIRQERGGSVLSEIIDAWLAGAGLHELDEYTQKINAVSATDIQRLAQTYFVDDRRVEGIVRGVGKTV